MGYRTDWEPHQVIGFTVVITLCVVFLAFMTTVFIRWAGQPYYPPQPTPTEISSQACKDKGGVPKTKWEKIEGYSPKEVYDTCEVSK